MVWLVFALDGSVDVGQSNGLCRLLLDDFQTILNGNNTIDASGAFLCHLLLKVAANGAAENDVAFLCFATETLLRQVGVVIDGVLHSILKTNDRVVRAHASPHLAHSVILLNP